jgi:pimeloyl-ACP methyl ester carboxylesterase
MPFIRRDGVRIHYETVGSGPALLLHHPTAGSAEDWIESGYVEALGKDRQVILVDSRGHGQSDKPYDLAAYDVRLRASDVIAVLDELGIHQADYFGYSLGGWIAFEVGRQAPGRFRSFAIGAAHPYAESMQAFRNLMTPEASQTFVNSIQGLSDAQRARFLANDMEALRILSHDRDANLAALEAMKMPCLLFVGDLDPRLEKVRQCAAALPDATLVIVPGCDHMTTLARIDLVAPHVRRFLSKLG